MMETIKPGDKMIMLRILCSSGDLEHYEPEAEIYPFGYDPVEIQKMKDEIYTRYKYEIGIREDIFEIETIIERPCEGELICGVRLFNGHKMVLKIRHYQVVYYDMMEPHEALQYYLFSPQEREIIINWCGEDYNWKEECKTYY